MLFIYSDALTGNECALEAGLVMEVRRGQAENGSTLLETHIITSVMTPQGPMARAARESVEEISRRSNLARNVKQGDAFDLTSLGFTAP